ncbi:MAG: beta-N-acetylhexosaminidase [Deltaproteobacteria bacterium]|nr:beta-N-acetylhexosaminidase [Deltaproteobacteria bacterium]
MKSWLKSRTLEEVLGQLFMVGIQSPRFSGDADFLVNKIRAGGFILFKRNYQDPQQLAELCRRLQTGALESQGLPLLIAIDQEGGRVLRLGPPFTQIPAPAEMAGGTDPGETLRRYARITARELKLAGISMNLSPVLDVNLRGPEGLMASRCLGTEPETVGRLGRLYISELQRQGIMATAKHFPGIGDIELDPHQDLPVQPKDQETLGQVELVPFREALSVPVDAVMMTHTIYPAWDPRWPASLSTALIAGLLRRGMGYRGLVITDDLEMGAIGRHFEIEEAVYRAFEAEADILLICHDPEKIERAYRYLLQKFKEGRLSESRLRDSVERVLFLKKKYLQKPFPPAAETIRAYFQQTSAVSKIKTKTNEQRTSNVEFKYENSLPSSPWLRPTRSARPSRS